MKPLGIFISSVQREFAEERAALRDYLRGDPLMRRFFDPFLFEDVPATDRRPDALYLDEVERCELYVGLFGDEYGTEDEEGLSPTEREFDHATALGKQRLIFLKAARGTSRHPKMAALIGKAQAGLIRARFGGTEDLVAALYASLVEYLGAQELLRWEPFDVAACPNAGFDDLDPERMVRFVGTAGRARQFPLSEDAPPEALLEHLNLLNKGRPTNAAILLFGRAPQRFLISSQIKCAHFHGTQVAKPIPSHQVYTGTVFELVDHAVDFVLSKIALSVGTRAESIQAPVAYEIPKEVITEAIVNAVAHRDYASGGSVQVMLFADRLEVWNPGDLPPPLTLDKLRVPHESIPGNPLLARAMYLVKYIEQMGTGTLDMIRRCLEAGLPEPEFEAAGEFVTRIRRPAPAGQAAVFTDRKEARAVSGKTNPASGQPAQQNCTNADPDVRSRDTCNAQVTLPTTLDVHGLMRSLSRARPIFHSEADFQFALAWRIRELTPTCEVRLEYRVQLEDKPLRVDLWLPTLGAAIELKYKTRQLLAPIGDESYSLEDQSARNLSRYDFLDDVRRLERIVEAGQAKRGFAVMLTNDRGYWAPPTAGSSTDDAAFRLHEGREICGPLEWAQADKLGAKKNRKQPISLSGSYNLNWHDYSDNTAAAATPFQRFGTSRYSRYSQFRYLVISVGD